MANKRLTHFLSLRLDPVKFSPFFDHVASTHPQFSSYLVSPNSMHITLLVLTIPRESIPYAIHVLRVSCEASIAKWFPHLIRADDSRHRNFHVCLRGVGTFGNGRVIWARVVDDSGPTSPAVGDSVNMGICELSGLAHDLHEAFSQCGFVPERYEFKPHATLLKIRVPPGSGRRQQGSVTVDPSAYLPFAQHDFGAHAVASVELSEMGAMDPQDGFYQCAGKAVFR
ncbi:hypothetical protein HDU84_001428 [Entophlyctis sp. JEL0112]|nr:hypothetical protein HDU84_001428 [Entophlyctis sp. JEL0112]